MTKIRGTFDNKYLNLFFVFLNEDASIIVFRDFLISHCKLLLITLAVTLIRRDFNQLKNDKTWSS